MRPTRRPGHHAGSTVRIPTGSELGEGAWGAPGCRVLKVERKSVLWRCQDPVDGSPVVFKMYRNRGGVSWLREKAFQFRVEREFQALQFLCRAGIPCSVPLFWSFGHHPHHGRWELLCMREIQAAESLPELVAGGRQHEIDFAGLFALLRRMHRAGFHHGRMEPRDVLVAPAEDGHPRLHIIDTPHAMAFGGDITFTTMARMEVREISLWAHRLLGEDACRSLLTHYGLDEAAATATLRDLRRPDTPRLVRHIRRFIFGLRSRFSRLGKAEDRSSAEA